MLVMLLAGGSVKSMRVALLKDAGGARNQGAGVVGECPVRC